MKDALDYDPTKPVLLPADPGQWLPEGHLAYFVHDVVSLLDLKPIYASYVQSGTYPPYEPRMMVRIWVYAMMEGIYSTREIETALYDNIAFRLLSGNRFPDHRALSEFRKRHRRALGVFMWETAAIANRARFGGSKQVATDGNEVQEDASKHSAEIHGQMKKAEDRIWGDVERYLRQSEEADMTQEGFASRLGWELPEGLRTAEERRIVIESMKSDRAEESKEKPDGE